MAAEGLRDKAAIERSGVVGDRMVAKVLCMNQGDLSACKAVMTARAEVRAPIVATKPDNAGGAKGCRKVDTGKPE